MVSSELSVDALQRSVSVSLRLLDTVLVGLLVLVVVGVVLRLRHGNWVVSKGCKGNGYIACIADQERLQVYGR